MATRVLESPTKNGEVSLGNSLEKSLEDSLGNNLRDSLGNSLRNSLRKSHVREVSLPFLGI